MSGRRPIDQAVRRLLEGKSLPQERFASLNQIAARAASRGDARRGGRDRWYWGIAAVAAAIAVSVTLLQYRAFMPLSADVYQRIADEVAINHIKLKPLEVRSGDLSKVREFFAPLGFELVESVLFEDTPWRMTGGRFCTIRGEAAAQLRMQDTRGRAQTVYQVPYAAAVHRVLPDVGGGEEPLQLYSRGLEVRLWRERGLLFAAVSQ